MRVDTNTRGHRQWFYFSVKSRVKHTVKFNIYRFKKHFSLFQRGMKPYVRSVKSKEEWKPGGSQVKYLREKQANENGVKKGNAFFYLSFRYKFQHDQDEVFFAAGIPYTYSFLQERLLYFENQVQRLNPSLKFCNSIVGKSTCGLDLRVVKICHDSYQTQNLDQTKNKRAIVINARSHSGEASSSWVLDGIIDFLTTNPSTVFFLQHFRLCFYIFPMLNPDGVFVGNYRTGIVGDDFNRKFATGKKQIFPQIFYLKKLIAAVKKQANLLMFMDLHGHSILKNSFLYGPSDTDFHQYLLKKLPFYLWHKSKYFKMSSCKFKTQKEKIETARMYFQMKENILSFTCENSLGLYGTSQQTFQMTKQDWQKFGVGIVEAIKATMETQKQVMTCLISKEQQNLRLRQIPQIRQQLIKEPSKQETKVLTVAKVLQPYKMKIKQKYEACSKKSNNENLTNKKGLDTTVTRIFHKVESTKEEKTPQSIFSMKGLSGERSLEIKARMNEIRQRFPSLTSKEQKSKELITGQMKAVEEGSRRRHSVSGVQTHKFTDQQRKSFVSKLKSGSVETPKDIEEIQLAGNVVESLEKNEKKEFLESLYHRKELKQLKQQKKQCHELGKNLIPSSQSIREKLEQKKNKTFLNQNVSKKQKKYICDSSSQKSDNPFDIIDIQLKDIRVERAVTYDESYLAAQIIKAREMKQTEREYHEESEIDGWVSKDEVIFEENFSQNFDDSVNDEDSCDEDLPEHQKKYIFDYVRAHQNARRDKMMDGSQSQEEKQPEKTQDNMGSGSIFSQKKRIHGFREISFKSVCTQSQQRSYTTPTHKLGIGFTTSSKIRKNPHKFQESLGIIKYKSFSRKIEPQGKEAEAEIYITHKKRLNERSMKKQSRKEPFVLLSIKEKAGGRIP